MMDIMKSGTVLRTKHCNIRKKAKYMEIYLCSKYGKHKHRNTELNDHQIWRVMTFLLSSFTI